MQNFRINESSDTTLDQQERELPLSKKLGLGESINFINCKSGILIAYDRDSDDRLEYMVPVCLGFPGAAV